MYDIVYVWELCELYCNRLQPIVEQCRTKKISREMEKHEMNTYGVAEKPLNREVLRGILVSSAHPQIRSRVVSPTAKQ